MQTESSTGTSHPAVPLLLLATLATVLISYIPFAQAVTYPFLIFTTFIHEIGHAVATLVTAGSVESLSVTWDGSGVTYSRGGIRAIVSSAGYLGTALFGGALLVLSRNRNLVRPALAGCALLIGMMTAIYAGNANRLLIFLCMTLIAAFAGMSLRSATPGGRARLLFGSAVVSFFVLAYLTLTGSLFSWAVGLFITLALIAVLRFGSISFAHFFLSFLAVQCSLNALEAIYNLYSLSIRASCRTDAQSMATLTGLPAWFWAVLWAAISIIILGISLWLFARPAKIIPPKR